ncbi:MAG: hypothetical protein J1F28_10745 [Oscillospiraceae bacterium]|nr:hypothetical protein [Oscillospiraceae bacterium]
MKTCDEMVNSLLKRREQFLIDKKSEQKQKRRTALEISYAGGFCALAAVIFGVGVFNSGILREKKTIVSDNSSAANSEQEYSSWYGYDFAHDAPLENKPQAPDFSSVIWGEGSSGISHDSSITEDLMRQYWNGKEIYGYLYYAFEENDDDCVFAVLARHRCYDDNCSFAKTQDRFLDEDYAWTEKIGCMGSLAKNGDELKYGEALYLTGTPDGVKWAKEYYDRTVSEIGEELLSKYIVDGEFLKDELARDIETECAEREKARDAFEKAYNEHRADACKTLMKQLEARGIYCELKSGLNGLIIYISKADFAELTLENPENWVFGLASKDSDCTDTDLVVIYCY